MKIAYLSNCTSPHALKFLYYFRDKGHEVHVVTFHPKDISGVKVHSISEQQNFISKRIAVKRIIQEISPDILHAHQVIGYGMWGALSGFHPFIVSAWGSDVEIIAKQSLINRKIAKHVLQKADRVHVPADCMKKTVIDLGCKKENVFVQLTGVDTESFSPSKRDAKLRKELGTNKIIISTRMLNPIYSTDTIIKAAPRVLEKYPNAVFVLLGDGEERKHLEGLVRDMKVQKSVKFLGWKDINELPRYLASSDIYIDTLAASAGISIGLIEAMSSGLPSVVAEIPGVRDAINDLENGLIFPPRDHKRLATMILKLLDDEQLRTSIGKMARETALSIGDISKNMQRFQTIYEELVGTTFRHNIMKKQVKL